MHYVRRLLVPLFLSALVACGGPAPTPPPPPPPSPPSATAVTPTAAARGEAVVVTGSDLGTSGTLLIGGVEATVTSWEDTRIEATIAAGTPDAWQEVKVTNENGSDSLSPFFVGAEFTGAAAELQEFLDELSKGTAVLLQAATYDLSAEIEPLLVDNHSLHGRGNTQTVIRGPDMNSIVVLVDYGEAATLADLRLESDDLVLLTGSVSDSDDLYSLSAGSSPNVRAWNRQEIGRPASRLPDLAGHPWSADSSADLAEWLAATSLALQRPIERTAPLIPPSLLSAAISPSALKNPHLTIRNVAYAEVNGGGGIESGFMGVPSLELELVDVEITAPDSYVYLASSGGITFDRVKIEATGAGASTIGSRFVVRDSELEFAEGLGLEGFAGIEVLDSTLRVTNSNLWLIGGDIGGSLGIPLAGPIEISRSTLEALDADFTDGDNRGDIYIVTAFAPIVLTDNVLIRAHNTLSIVTEEGNAGEADVTLTGNADIRVGVFKSESATDFRPGMVGIISVTNGGAPDTLTLTGNTITSTGGMEIGAGDGYGGILLASNNKLRATEGGADGIIQLFAGMPSRLEVSGNTVDASQAVVLLAGDLHGTMAVVRGNVISVTADANPFFGAYLAGGSCEVSSNRISASNPSNASPASAAFACAGSDPLVDTFDIHDNDISASGAASSGVGVEAAGITTAMTGNKVTSSGGAEVNLNTGMAEIASSTFQLGAGGITLSGRDEDSIVFSGNTVTHHNLASHALALYGFGTANVTGNGFTNTGSAGGTALSIETNGGPMALTVRNNTFVNLANALRFLDAAGSAHGFSGAISDNVFDFPIDTAPKAAVLENVKSQIDARNNRWGTNTSAATVATYVGRAGDTVAQGGSILIDPITQP